MRRKNDDGLAWTIFLSESASQETPSTIMPSKTANIARQQGSATFLGRGPDESHGSSQGPEHKIDTIDNFMSHLGNIKA